MKKNFLKPISLLILVSFGLTSCTIKQVPQEKRTVTVTGTGLVELENDEARLSLSVNTRNWDVIKATEENARLMSQVQTALLKEGVTSDYLSTSGFSIYQETSYQNGRTVSGQYNVTNNINIIIKDVSKAGKIIDIAVRAGANQLSSLNYSVSNTEAAVKQARILAVKQAEKNANTLATSSASALGRVLSIEEEYSNYSAPQLYMSNAASNAKELSRAETPTSAGKTTVSVTVKATYELQ